MKAIVLAAATLALCAATATAQNRPLSSAMTCGDVQRLVARSGSVILGFTQHTYDKVVSDSRFCLASEALEIIHVPTRDTRHCFAGYTCKEGDTGKW